MFGIELDISESKKQNVYSINFQRYTQEKITLQVNYSNWCSVNNSHIEKNNEKYRDENITCYFDVCDLCSIWLRW